jgi:hypothetical protein
MSALLRVWEKKAAMSYNLGWAYFLLNADNNYCLLAITPITWCSNLTSKDYEPRHYMHIYTGLFLTCSSWILIAIEFLSFIFGLSLHLNSAVHFRFRWHSVKRPNWRHSFKIRLSWCTAWQLRMAFALCTCATWTNIWFYFERTTSQTCSHTSAEETLLPSNVSPHNFHKPIISDTAAKHRFRTRIMSLYFLVLITPYLISCGIRRLWITLI